MLKSGRLSVEKPYLNTGLIDEHIYKFDPSQILSV